MRFLSCFLAISLAVVASSCKTHDRQQYSYSYRAPIHVVPEKKMAPPRTDASAPAESATAPALPAAH